MKKVNLLKSAAAFSILLALASCSKNADKQLVQTNPGNTKDMISESGKNPDEISVTNVGQNNNAGRANGHYLYTESNGTGANEILVYKVNNNGSLNHEGSISSGGAGTGAPLGSQGALVLDKENEWLYAVNAAGNSVSSFKVNNNGNLTLAHTENTQGTTPVSVTVHGNLLYVLNRG